MEPPTELTVEVTLKPHDVYTPFQWDRNNLARWVVAIVLCWIFYDLYRGELDALRSFPSGDSMIAVVIALVVFILLALLVFPYLRVRAMFRRRPSWKEKIKYTFNAEGMRFASDDGNGAFKWSAFERIVETKKVFALGRIYIPKRCFASGADAVLLRQLISANFKGKLYLRNF